MRTAVYGATGRTGSRILDELVHRKHHVVAITRDAQPPSVPAGTTWKTDNLTQVREIADAIRGSDAVISAYAAPPNDADALVGVCERLAEAVECSLVQRLLVVGGAGVLEVSPGVTLLDSGRLPPEWVPMASAHSKALASLRQTPINWTYISPAALFEPGERTGVYRTSNRTLMMNQKGESRISMEDFAIALVDELEQAKHLRESFAVAW
jgi:putative NADH-flavin reductase